MMMFLCSISKYNEKWFPHHFSFTSDFSRVSIQETLILVIIIFVGKISSFEQTVTDKNAEGSWNMQDVSPFCTFWTGVGGGGE